MYFPSVWMIKECTSRLWRFFNLTTAPTAGVSSGSITWPITSRWFLSLGLVFLVSSVLHWNAAATAANSMLANPRAINLRRIGTSLSFYGLQFKIDVDALVGCYTGRLLFTGESGGLNADRVFRLSGRNAESELAARVAHRFLRLGTLHALGRGLHLQPHRSEEHPPELQSLRHLV